MSQMKTITEEQAQQLANILGMTIAVDRDETVCGFTSMPYKYMDYFQWNPSDFEYMIIPIRIASSRPWTEQIWRPEV